MDKYHDTLQDTAGGILIKDTIIVKDAATGLNAVLYEDDETTIISQPFSTDAEGNLSFKAANGVYDIYIDGIAEKDGVRLFDPAEPIASIDINGGTITGITDLAVEDGGTGASTASGALTNLGFSSFAKTLIDDANAAAAQVTLSAKGVIDTLANLKAETNLTNGRAIFLTDSGRGGEFVFDSSNLSTEVTADTQNGIYVPPNSDSTGASGAWVRQYSGAVDVKWFGSAGDGSTDDSTEISAALAHQNTVGFPEPQTSYFCNAAISLASNQYISGQGKVLGGNNVGNGGGIFDGSSISYVVLDNLYIDAPSVTNLLRGVKLTNVESVRVNRSRLVADKRGTYPVLAQRSNNKLGFSGNNVVTDSYGLISKSDFGDVGNPAYQTKNVLFDGNIIDTNTTNDGAIGIVLDTAHINGLVVNNIVLNMLDTNGTVEGFGVGLANENGNEGQQKQIVVGFNAIYNCLREGIHQEDTCRNIAHIGNAVTSSERAIYVITNEDPRNINIIANMGDTLGLDGVVCAGTTGASLRDSNVAFNIMENYGNTSASQGISIGDADTARVNLLANVLTNSTGNGVSYKGSKANVSYNIAQAVSGYGIVGAASGEDEVLVESNNILSGATSGPIDTSNMVGVIGDKRLLSELLDTSSTNTVSFFVPRRPGIITDIKIIYENAADGSVQPFSAIGKKGGSEFASIALGTTALQWDIKTVNSTASFTSRQFAAGDVITIKTTTGTGNTYFYRVQIEYFEYS